MASWSIATAAQAVDPGTGYFAQDAWSFWSPTRDGNRPPEGGAASQLPDYWARKIFTSIAGSDLNAPGNRIEPNNAALTPEMLGAPDDFDDVLNMTELRKTVQWLNGWDVNDENDNDPEGDGPIDTLPCNGRSAACAADAGHLRWHAGKPRHDRVYLDQCRHAAR